MKQLLIILLHLHVFGSFAQNWQEVSPVPGNGRDDGAAFSIGGYGYVVTGNLGGFSESNRLWRYDASGDSWSESASFPGTPRQYAGSFTLGGEGYILCGIAEGNVELNDCWKYSPETDSWTRIADLPGAARWSVFSFASPYAGYLGSGGSPAGLLEDFWKYDPQTNSWTQLDAFPGGKCRETACFAAGEKALVTLGYDTDYNFITASWEFNMFSEHWSRSTDFPGAGRAYATGGTANALGYVAGGSSKENVFFNDVLVYDFNTKNWNEAGNLPTAGIRGMAAFTIAGKLFFATGLNAGLERVSQVFKIPYETEASASQAVYPNPSDGSVIIKAPDGSGIRIITTDGRLYRELKVENENTLWADELPPGHYFVEIVWNGKAEIHRLVVR